MGTKSKPPIISTAQETHNLPPYISTDEPPSIPIINPGELIGCTSNQISGLSRARFLTGTG
jgi:hypothetical protein